MSPPILSPRARVRADQAETLLRCYAARLSPKEAARRAGLSLNTLYAQYNRIRWRLILVGYYRGGARSVDEPGLGPETRKELKRRRGLGPDDIYAHAAEAMEWANEWPPALVLRHLRKIVALTGPLDQPPELSPEERHKLDAYIRYARTQLIHDRTIAEAQTDETRIPCMERTKAALDNEWRAFRAASKHVERMEDNQKVKGNYKINYRLNT